MFSSPVLEVAIGLIFTFLAVSLVTGAIIETITSVVGWRAVTLHRGIRKLLNDSAFSGLAKDLYHHALVNPRSPGQGGAPDTWGISRYWKWPSYIGNEQFANAFMDIMNISATIAANPPVAGLPTNTHLIPLLKTAVDGKTTDPQLREFLHGAIERNLGDPTKIKTDLENWFDSAMDRLSGVYKRWTQFLSFFIALPLAVLLNINSIEIAKALWENPTLAEYLKPPAGVTPGTSQAAARRPESAAAAQPPGGAAGATPPADQPPAAPGAGTPPTARAPNTDSSEATQQLKAAREALNTLETYLPVGWPNGFFVTTTKPSETAPQLRSPDGKLRTDKKGEPLYEFSSWEWSVGVLGWLIAAISTLFGAPFWFDALQRFSRLKGTAASPAEKKTDKVGAPL